MRTLFYKGFWIQAGCGYGHPYPETMVVRDGPNNQYLDGRRNMVEPGPPFYFSTLAAIKAAIDRYQELRPDDPIFHGRWKNSSEMEELAPMDDPKRRDRLRLALRIVAGRLDQLVSEDYVLLGFDYDSIVEHGPPEDDEVRDTAEDLLLDALEN